MKTLIAILACFLLNLPMQAQSEAEAPERELVVQSTRNSRREYSFTADTKINYKLHNQRGRMHGNLEEIHDSSLVISGVEYSLSDFRMLEPRDVSKERDGLTLIGIGGGGLIATIVSASMIFSQGNNQTQERMGYILAGAMILFPLIYFVGLLIYSSGRKYFNLKRNQWNVFTRFKE